MLETIKAWEPIEDALIFLRLSLGVNADQAGIAHLDAAMVAAYKATRYAKVHEGHTPSTTPDTSAHTHEPHAAKV